MLDEKIIIPAGKTLVFFDKDNYFFCDGIGKTNKFFTGNILLCPIKSELDDFNYHFNTANYFVNNFDFGTAEDIYIKNSSVFLIGDKDFNPDIIQRELLDENLFLFSFSNDILINILNQSKNKAIFYFAEEESEFDFFYLEKYLSSQSFPYDHKIENKNCTQSTLFLKHESYLNFLKPNVVVIDLGDIDKSLLKFLSAKYNVYIMNLYSDIKEIKDVRPSMIFISDGHANLEKSFEQLSDLIFSLTSLKVKIFGFGLGFLILAKFIDKFYIDDCDNFEFFSNIFDKKMITSNSKRAMYHNLRLREHKLKDLDSTLNVLFSFPKTDIVGGFEYINKKRKYSIFAFVSPEMYIQTFLN